MRTWSCDSLSAASLARIGLPVIKPATPFAKFMGQNIFHLASNSAPLFRMYEGDAPEALIFQLSPTDYKPVTVVGNHGCVMSYGGSDKGSLCKLKLIAVSNLGLFGNSRRQALDDVVGTNLEHKIEPFTTRVPKEPNLGCAIERNPDDI